jgi:hypothetical protein
MFIRYTKIIKIMKSLPAYVALRVFFKYFWQKQRRGSLTFADKFKNTQNRINKTT